MTLDLALLKPSSHENWPEEFDGHLECNYYSICCSFNRKGSLLAVGCNDGHIVIWDFLTRLVVKTIAAHAGHPVCSVNWSRNGLKLVSCSMDNSIAIWETRTGNNIIRWTLPSPIIKAQFNPRNDKFVLVCPVKCIPILAEIDYHVTPEGVQLAPATIEHKILPTESDPNIVASFDRRGQHIYTGNTRGRIVIFKCPASIDSEMDLEIVSSFRIPSNPPIREIEFGTHNKTFFLVNSSDRAIRIYDCKKALESGLNGTCDEIRKIQDSVAKTMYHNCCFSGDPSATYICVDYQTSIQIYETETGTVKKIIPGEKGDQIVDLQLHPIRPIAVSVSSGKVSVWARPQIENWSAFAPEFQELEKNMEYDERESEFDIEDEDAGRKVVKGAEIEEPEEVDVLSVQPLSELLSSDEEKPNDCLDFIPITLDDPEMIDLNPLEAMQIEHQQLGDLDKKHSPQKSGNRRKIGSPQKRPRSGEKSKSAKKILRQT